MGSVTLDVDLPIVYDVVTPQGTVKFFPEWEVVPYTKQGWDLDELTRRCEAKFGLEVLIHVPDEVLRVVGPPVKVRIRHVGLPQPDGAVADFGTTFAFPFKFLAAPLMAGLRMDPALNVEDTLISQVQLKAGGLRRVWERHQQLGAGLLPSNDSTTLFRAFAESLDSHPDDSSLIFSQGQLHESTVPPLPTHFWNPQYRKGILANGKSLYTHL